MQSVDGVGSGACSTLGPPFPWMPSSSLLCCVVQGLQQATWPEAFAAIRKAAGAVKGSEMRAVAGRLADAESLVAVKDMFNRLGAGDLRVSQG